VLCTVDVFIDMHSTLPDANSPSLGLVQPSHDQVLEMTRMTAVEWKGALPTSDAYERREKLLSAQRLTKNGGQTYWALVDMALAPSNRQMLACCETIRKKALVARDGNVQDTISHAIGGVYCYPALRGRGYGARMMKELATSLRTWQASEGELLFSTLYSDIGKVTISPIFQLCLIRQTLR
jgi:GNAT superfamily N-acetyltransferase